MKGINFVLLLFVSVAPSDALGKFEIPEKVKDELSKATTAIDNIDTKDAIGIACSIINFGTLIPDLAPFAEVISTILGIIQLTQGNDDQKDPIEEHLKQMDSQLLRIEVKLDQLFDHVEDTTIKQNYKNHVEMITNLAEIYKLFLKDPSANKDNLVRRCQQNQMLDFNTFIHNEFKNEIILPLPKMILRQYDMELLGTWAKIISSNLAKASYLNVVCFGATHNFTQNGTSTISRKALADTSDEFTNTFSELSSFFKDKVNFIKNNYYEKANDEISNQAGSSASHESFTQSLHNFLNEKYYWRSWVVVSYSSGASGYDKHSVCDCGKHVHYQFRGEHRSFYVASTNNNGANFEASLENCISSRRSESRWYPGHSPVNIYNDMSSCLGSVNGLGVVRFGQGLWASYSSAAPMTNVQMSWTGYSVFAAAPEIDDDLPYSLEYVDKRVYDNETVQFDKY